MNTEKQARVSHREQSSEVTIHYPSSGYAEATVKSNGVPNKAEASYEVWVKVTDAYGCDGPEWQTGGVLKFRGEEERRAVVALLRAAADELEAIK